MKPKCYPVRHSRENGNPLFIKRFLIMRYPGGAGYDVLFGIYGQCRV